eukprot:COSAG05_NODE_11338_length_518_cov_0.947494_2_plen_155_part_01
MSVSLSGGASMPMPSLPTDEKRFDARLNGKKVQLQLGGMGLQVFDRNGKPETHMYQSLLSWEETDKGFRLTVEDGKTLNFATADGDGEAICMAMKEKAQELAEAKRADKSKKLAEAKEKKEAAAVAAENGDDEKKSEVVTSIESSGGPSSSSGPA